MWVVAALMLVAGLLVAEYKASRLGIAVLKIASASTFVLLAISSGALESSYGRVLLAGLILCWLGDALLLAPGQSKGFQLGIGAFLLGHVAYTIAFFQLGVDAFGLVAGGLLMSGGALAALSWLRPKVPADFDKAVMSYVAVISLMVAAAVGTVAAGRPILIAVGAIGFAVSDVSVARDRFVSPGFTNAVWGLPLYFGSQMLLAASVADFAGA